MRIKYLDKLINVILNPNGHLDHLTCSYGTVS